MASSLPPATAGAPPPGAAPSAFYTSPGECQPAKEREAAAAADAQEVKPPPLPWEDSSEAEALEHEEKVGKYQAVLAARLKAKYFSRNAFDKGDVFEEIHIQSETIQLSRWPFTSLFVDPAKFCGEKNCTEDISSSLTTGSAKDDPPLTDQASLKK